MDTKPRVRPDKPPVDLRALLDLKRLFSDDGLTKKAYLTAIAAALDYGARLFTGFWINRWLVAGLGDYLYGVWQILADLVGYASAASGRPTQTLKWTIANRQASTDYDEKRRQVGSTVMVWLMFLPLLVAVGGWLAWFAPVWLKSPPELVWVVRWSAILLMADLIITSLIDVPESVLRGENLGYKRMGLTTFLVFVQAGVIALALWLKTGLVGVSVAVFFDTLLTGALFFYVVRSYVPWFGIARPAWAEVRRFLGLSWWFLIWRFVMQVMTQSDVVVLGLIISAEQVTPYALTKYTPVTLVSVVAIVVGGITPGLGGLIGAGNLPKANRVRNELTAGTWLVITIIGAATLLWNQSFVQLWVGAEHYAGAIPNLLIVLVVVQFILIRNDANIIDLTLDLRRKVIIGALSAGLSVALAVMLVGPLNLGIVGLCLGLMAGRVVLSLGYPFIIGRFLGVSLASQLRSTLRPALITCAIYALATSLGTLWTASTWIGLMLAVGATLAVVSPITFYAGLTSDQRQHLWQRIRAVVRPKPI